MRKKMKPLPKWMGVVGTLTTFLGVVQSLVQDPTVAMLAGPKVVAVVTVVGALVAQVSHSLTGKGGKP